MNKKNGLNSNQIKLIAIIAMTIDHITWLLFPGCQKIWWVMGLHIIGRLTAPIMWFFIAEGFHYTRNVGKYIIRLFFLKITPKSRHFTAKTPPLYFSTRTSAGIILAASHNAFSCIRLNVLSAMFKSILTCVTER